MSLIEGGDQISSIVLILLLPHTLLDSRTNHFLPATGRDSGYWNVKFLISRTSVVVTKVQISIIYFIASTGKFSSPEWQDGSSVYSWVRHVDFGPAEWMAPAVHALTSVPAVTLLITWSTLVIELALGLSLLLNNNLKRLLLPLAVLFHLGILIILGLPSFSITMIGCVIILLGESFNNRDLKIFSSKLSLNRGGSSIVQKNT